MVALCRPFRTIATVVRRTVFNHLCGMKTQSKSINVPISTAKKRTDSLGRRSRFSRQSKGKHITLSNRDIEIFCQLWRYRFLGSDRINRYFQPCSNKRLVERLGDLFHESFHLYRPTAQWAEAKAEQKHITYSLTKKGVDALIEARQKLFLPSPAVSFAGGSERTIVQFHHAKQISQIIFDIECNLQLAVRTGNGNHDLELQNSGNRQLIVEREIVDRVAKKTSRNLSRVQFSVIIPKSEYVPHQKTAHRTQIIPDACFGIKQQRYGQSLYRFYALEVERHNPLRRGNLEKPSTLKKLLAYQSLIRNNGAQQQMTLPNLFVIFAARTEKQLFAIIDMANRIWSVEEQKFLLFAPPACAPSWDDWLENNFQSLDTGLGVEHTGRSFEYEPTHPNPSITNLQSSFSSIMEIAQKWREHFEP